MAGQQGSRPDTAGRGACHVLVGETGAGKTDVAQLIAEELGWTVCSADSMQVYRGMDIGTAKPTRAMRDRVRYLGLDCVEPDQPFSVGRYIGEVVPAIEADNVLGRCVLVAGGTGLYIRALLGGLDPLGASDPERVKHWTDECERLGCRAIFGELERTHPRWAAFVADPENPRRVVRAMALAEAGASPPERRAGAQGPTVLGLRLQAGDREKRIVRRAAAMYLDGLLDETAGLLARYPGLSSTARHAIGYAEAADCLAGRCTRDEAVERTAVRTRQYARRQRTWFRHQLRVDWIDVPAGAEVRAIARLVMEGFRRNGPVTIG
ncbi:MAG: tRNA (adenosine(37)-N6)-dimethylallyltransferase MiaA [Lentisphaerae bacterium]|nr:tRNA (adenosine(37)-N6)-dimethylallyltransferase MiaA [Lentisphaerota bacterium]